MNNEIEAKYLDIDKAAIRKKLKAAGALLLDPEKKMRRTVFDTGPNSYARVRDEGDKIVLTYKNFIDEAKTKSFLEKGDWQDQDRELLYQKAYKKMLNRCMTPQNIKSAANNATQQFHQLLKSMGYEKIKIKIKSTK